MNTRSKKLRMIGALSATVILLSCSLPAAAEAIDTGPDVVVNGSFEQFGGVNPDKWSTWQPAGTGRVEKVDGVAGALAVQITTDSTASRLALLQDVPVTAGLYRLDFMTRRTGMSGTGTAGIRVNVAGASSAPFIGGNTDTSGWQQVTGWVRVPSGSTSARLHLFNDMVRGSMAVDDVRFSRVDADGFVMASTTAAGDIGLDWEISNPARVDHYDIQRTEAGSDAPATTIRRVPASLTEATDQDWEPGKSYTYKIVARDAQGAELFRTTEAPITAPAKSNILRSSLASLSSDGKTHLSWAAARDTSGTISLFAADNSLEGGNLSGATEIATGIKPVGSSDITTAAKHFALVADGKVIATASTASEAHPRIMLSDEVLAKIQRLTSVPGTPQEMYKSVTQRVDAGIAGSGTSADRYSREAGFLYQVTGQQRYADLAFDAFKVAADQTPFGAKQALDTANPVSQLAITYDWAYNGWTPEQRAFAQEYFERTSVFLELADHPNMTRDDKGSNWVGVTRGAELAQHLAVRGDGDYGMRDARIARLLDQLTRHAEEGYTDQGWYQEGLDYLDYDNMIATTGILGSFDAGIDAVKNAWYQPDTANLLLHADSLRQGANSSLQWGVGTGGHASWPLYLDRVAKDGDLARGAAMFERTQGHLSAKPWYSPAYGLALFAYWPEAEKPDLQSDKALPALFDDEAGVAMFRNRIQDANDVLIGMSNRNHQHLGWSGYDTFGLSLIAGDTMWAAQPAKDQTNAAKYSRVLVDGVATQAYGKGKTLATKAYDAQGGGYVLFDGSGNLGVQKATRESAVDMTTRGAADTIMTISDSFSDTKSHTWTWQLAPQAGVTAEIGDIVDGAREITLHRGEAWMRTWLLDAEGADVTYTGGVLRIVRTGTTADFDLVTAFGSSGEAPTAEIAGDIVRIDGFAVDTGNLADFSPASDTSAWKDGQSYRKGDQVSFEGSIYRAVRPTHKDEPGAVLDGPWQEMIAAGDTTFWTPTRSFARGDVVVYEGSSYSGLRPSRNAEPDLVTDAWRIIGG